MFKTVSDIVDMIQDFHEGLSKHFKCLKTDVEDQKVLMLLDYLCKSESFLAEYLEKYKEATPERTLKTWVKYVPWLPSDIFCECRDKLEIVRPMSVYDVMDIVLHFDECLIEFYTILVQEIQKVEVQEIFSNLLRVTRKHEMNLSRDISWLSDL